MHLIFQKQNDMWYVIDYFTLIYYFDYFVVRINLWLINQISLQITVTYINQIICRVNYVNALWNHCDIWRNYNIITSNKILNINMYDPKLLLK